MANSSSAKRPIQFSLAFLATIVTVVAIFVAFRMDILEVVSKFFYLISLAIFTIAAFASYRIQSCNSRLTWICILPLVATAIYACFAHYRFTYGIDDAAWPRSFPYPDKFLHDMFLWMKPRTESIPPNSINIDGGYNETLYTVIGIALVLSTISGWTIGLVIPKRMAR